MRSLKKIVLAASALVCAGTVAFAGELDTQQAKEAYSMENDDKNFALRNTFLGAWGYRSGDQIQDDLRSWASGNPVLQEQIEKIGAGRP